MLRHSDVAMNDAYHELLAIRPSESLLASMDCLN